MISGNRKSFRSRDNGRLVPWNVEEDGRADTHSTDAIRDLFSAEEITRLTDHSNGVPQRILDAIESKMLADMNLWIFGRKLVQIIIEQQDRLRVALLPDPKRHLLKNEEGVGGWGNHRSEILVVRHSPSGAWHGTAAQPPR